MNYTISLIIEDEHGSKAIKEVLQIKRTATHASELGITLQESKQLMKQLQEKIVVSQAQEWLTSQLACPCCKLKRRLKGYHSLQFRTLFGIVTIKSPRLFHCSCDTTHLKTFSPMSQWLSDKNSPELQYIESKWAVLVSYSLTAKMLQDVLPVGATQNASTVRNHLQKIAKQKEKELEDKPVCISGCANQWATLPKPDKPITVGIDGGYVRSWVNKRCNFEVIVGKPFSKVKSPKRFGLVQSIDKQPQRRLLQALRNQGMQENQQITFLSDGADNMRALQFIMHPESEHVLDWFHLTMRLTVLNQFAKGLIKSDPESGTTCQKDLNSAKFYLWHGNVLNALETLENCYLVCDNDEIVYKNKKKMIKHLEELTIYIENNRYITPNYAERWRYGEIITSSFVESTVNEVVTKRIVKKQQMQWTHAGAHNMIQIRTAVLNDELHEDFNRWYPGFNINNNREPVGLIMKKIA